MLPERDNELLCHIGPGTVMGDYARRFWTPVLLSRDLAEPDGPPIRIRILGEDLVAFRDTQGRVGLFPQACPHRGASLFFGRNEEAGLRCVYHGWKFDVDGACVDMPSEPAESNFKSKVRVSAYPTIEKAGLIWAFMGPSEKMPALPALEIFEHSDDHRHVMKHYQEANYLQLVEGEIDSSHVGFLHSSLDEPVTSRTASDWYLRYRAQDKAPKFFVRDTDYGILIGARRNAEEDSYYWRVTQWLTPFFTMIPRGPKDALNFRAWVPIDDENTWVFQVSVNPFRPLDEAELERYSHADEELVPGTHRLTANKDNDYLIDRDVQRTRTFSGIPLYPVRMGRGQDGAATESMGPIVDRRIEHLGTSDSAIIAMRRWLVRNLGEFMEGLEPYAASHGAVYRVRSGSSVLPKDVPFDEGERARVELFVPR